jgi:tetratricopeptide (TPR) repeat protein
VEIYTLVQTRSAPIQNREVIVREDEDFDGFIAPDGEMISIEDADRVSAILFGTADLGKMVKTLWHLAAECYSRGYFEAVCQYLEKMLPLVNAPGQKSECFLRMGGAREEMRDYEAAQQAYSRAFDLPQEKNITWYFINNNLAYCLNQTGRYQDAVKHCRAAIDIDAERHNAHKNLGFALSKLGRHADAANSYIRATKLCPVDPRALAFLDDLFAEHKELVQEIPDFPAQLHECHELVQGAFRENRV